MTQSSTLSLSPAVEERFANTISLLSADAIEEAQSGHAGMPMGMARAAAVLWSRHMKFNPANPSWHDRDRFVLSAGHGSMLLYALLHLTGFEAMTLDELKNFRQWGSKTAGHPEFWHAPGIETTTGPLGQGFANGVGMAIAERWLAATYNRFGFDMVDHHTYAIVSDGDLMEGIASEAASLAGHLKLGKLIYLYDDNRVTIDGYTDIAYTEDWAKRFDGYGWHVQSIDGMDPEAVSAAIAAAKADPRPSIIGCKTIIGYGNPELEGTPDIHSDPVGDDLLARTHEKLGFPVDRFHIPEEVAALKEQFIAAGKAQEATHNELWDRYHAEYPDAAADLQRAIAGQLPDGWADALPAFEPSKGAATRNTGGEVINALADAIPNLLSGSADLFASNKNKIKSGGDFQVDDYSGRNVNYGVREHGMGGILNGMAYHGGVIPVGATFLVFSDYMRGSMRLAALSGLPVIYVFTHDSIGVGEDGPTHQPVEQLPAYRAIPNMTLVRPADANEVAQGWKLALQNRTGPTMFTYTRQGLPTFDRAGENLGAADGLLQGGYVFYENDANPDLVLIASGSEVAIAYDAAKALAADGVNLRVVSLPSWEVFGQQSQSYRDSVLPPDAKKLGIEAAVPFGWERWVGNDKTKGDVIGIDRFGASAPYARVYEELGLTVDNVVIRAKQLLDS